MSEETPRKTVVSLADIEKAKNKPYISVNKLAEYMNASAVRRRQILRSLKSDKDFRKARYSAVRAVLKRYFESKYDNSILGNVIADMQERLEDPKGLTKWAVDDINNSIIAAESLKLAILPSFTDYDIISQTPKLDEVELGGVTVTIKPEIYLRHKVTKKIGGIKIHFSKTEGNRLNQQSMKYAATIIKYGLMANGATEANIANEACLSIDVFNKAAVSATSSYKQSIDALTAACEEIAARWDTI